MTTIGIIGAGHIGSQVAKGFNHIRSSEITTDGTPTGTPNRRALAKAPRTI